ncbi:hypothetical protein JWG42_06015 [Desulfoprunum benzoelyticum]|uniref:YtkA-like domain-containing protein n=1 Tax=Desulfoprunum benzoelyticum TaxID=1506996 RepID=A0A840UP55_9BACT|nr:hypothetical protein [Desulfoprunum benzoelyticum]MBB5347415.1 hypothetical protein [Desulfoprunum benzoelyticum]MBM9529705.1 hypothetical protein [Desulfoprunum benzoelyticum]
MKTKIAAILATLLLALPLGALAASQEHGGHGTMKAKPATPPGDMKMDGMNMGGEMTMLGETTVDGVKAMAHLNDVGAAMARMGMQENYHLMVMFSDGATGAAIAEGTAALKVTDPAGRETGPMEMMAMAGQFGVDLALTEKGGYRFVVGTRLADGKTRQFQFQYTVQ